MGSTVVGLKAGIAAGMFFSGTVGLLNLFSLYFFRADINAYLTTVPGCSLNVDTCFYSMAFNLPSTVFFIFLTSLVYSGLYGRYVDYIPIRSYITRALLFSSVLLLFFIYAFGGGAITDWGAIPLSVGYAYLLSLFYRRYTREIEFRTETSDLTLELDGRNVRGRIVTLTVHSSHNVSAVAKEGSSFKEWATSGGVSLGDARRSETEMRVDGDGMLKASVARKQ